MLPLLLVCAVSVLVVSGATATENGLLRIPMVHMESGLEKLFRTGADLKLIDGLYKMNQEKAQGLVLRGEDGKPKPKPVPPTNDTLNLFKYFGTQYYGTINIGKPGRKFKMVIDTSWGYSWVPSSDCPRTLLPCAVHERYNHKQSSTYKPDKRSFNISDQYLGHLSNDVFQVGHLSATNQVFAEVTKLPFIFTLYETDGTLGLGFKDLSPGITPFFDNFVQQNKLKSIFSLYVNRDPTTPRGGSLFFGGIDYAHNRSAFTSVDVKSGYYWEFDMQKVSVVISSKERQDFCFGGCSALADTSSNTIIGPAKEIQAINTLIGAEKLPLFGDRYMIPCLNEYKGPKVSFTFANKEFTIKAQDYIQRIYYSGLTLCLSAFQPANPKLFPPNTWSLGGAFLYRYYTAFDVQKRKFMLADVS